ncbi:MAG TPA: hypothetical protein VFM98_25270 [Ramlibacter sp.]|uniref:hypothetical protein n=1 Tax=Ramlibacter sp. TaxID=1917967 RepID=UPI002D7EEB88|nr:hypothetical protein [Ramlibacter sp.]HET8748929.1 hypothetical protein [Ramlibacter sp.]
MHAFVDWLAATSLSLFIQNVLWIVPLVQIVHFIAVAIVLSSVLMIGLRRAGYAGAWQPVEDTLARFVPWIWWSLLLLVATGALLIIGEPARTLGNPSFWVKMALLAIVLVALARVSPGTVSRPAARGLVALNFLLWCGVAVAGRWIAYTKSPLQ